MRSSWSIQPPGESSKGFGKSPDRCRCLGLRIEDCVRPVLGDLLSKLPVPIIEEDRINDHAKAPEIACRKKVQHFVVVSTRAYVEGPATLVRDATRERAADRSRCQPPDIPGHVGMTLASTFSLRNRLR